MASRGIAEFSTIESGKYWQYHSKYRCLFNYQHGI